MKSFEEEVKEMFKSMVPIIIITLIISAIIFFAFSYGLLQLIKWVFKL